MDEIRLHKKPIKAIIILAGSTCFVFFGIWEISKENIDTYTFIMGYLTIAFFGLGIAVGLYHLLDRKPQIILNKEGIWDRSTKQKLIPWNLIKNAYPINISGQKFISLELDKDFEKEIKQYKWATKFNKAIGAQTINLQLGQLNVNSNRLTDLILRMTKLDITERTKEIKNVAQQKI